MITFKTNYEPDYGKNILLHASIAKYKALES